MNKIPIVFAFSNQFALPGWVSISSLILSANQKTNYHIFVMHEGLEKYHINNISKLIEKSNHKVKFIDISMMFKDLDNLIKPKYASHSNGPKMTSSIWPKLLYSRLFVSEILPDYKKIIVSDVDVLFKKDLSNIFNEDYTQFHYGLVAAEKRLQKNEGHERFSFYKNKYIYYSGFVIYNTVKMQSDDMFNKFRIAIDNYKEKLNGKITDLIILNMCSDSIHRIPFNYCVLESLILNNNIKNISEYSWLSQLYSDDQLRSFKEDPSIIHYTVHGKHRDKPWDRLSPPEEYKKFIYSSPYKSEWVAKKNLKKVIRKSKLLLIFSNTKLFKSYLVNYFENIFIFLTKICGPIFWSYEHQKRISKRREKINKKYQGLSNQEIFTKIYRENIWGNGENNDFNSGPGSHDSEFVDPYINEVCSFLKINKNLIVIDLGCGDFNIGSKIFKYAKKYIAIDIVKDLIERNRKKYKSDKLKFISVDVVIDDIPNGDCLLIKEVLQHLTNNEIKIILAKIKNYKYIFITESEPLFDLLPNIDKVKGPDCRTDIKSAVLIDEYPFNFRY